MENGSASGMLHDDALYKSTYFTSFTLEVDRYRHSQYRYSTGIDISDPKISAISISFTAALSGLLIYFIITSKVVDDVICYSLTSTADQYRCNEA